MEWMETTGRTLEEAKDAALDLLGVEDADAEFEVIEEAKMGLFGRVRVEARVRARVRPTAPRPKEERRDRRRRSGSPPRPEGDEHEPEVLGPVTPLEPPPSVPAPRPAPSARRHRQGGGARQPEDRERDEMIAETLSLVEQGAQAGTFLEGLLRAFGMEGQVELREVEEGTIEAAVSGEDLGLLIGPKGATLSAIQDLARTVVQRHSVARTGRLLVDISGYRQRRREALERFTRQVADAVLASGDPAALEPMTPADRKVVHDTANTIEGVKTTSEGEEPRRRVVLMPG